MSIDREPSKPLDTITSSEIDRTETGFRVAENRRETDIHFCSLRGNKWWDDVIGSDVDIRIPFPSDREESCYQPSTWTTDRTWMTCTLKIRVLRVAVFEKSSLFKRMAKGEWNENGRNKNEDRCPTNCPKVSIAALRRPLPLLGQRCNCQDLLWVGHAVQSSFALKVFWSSDPVWQWWRPVPAFPWPRQNPWHLLWRRRKMRNRCGCSRRSVSARQHPTTSDGWTARIGAF